MNESESEEVSRKLIRPVRGQALEWEWKEAKTWVFKTDLEKNGDFH